VDVLCRLELRVIDFDEADQRRQDGLQALVFGERAPFRRRQRHRFPEAARPCPDRIVGWLARGRLEGRAVIADPFGFEPPQAALDTGAELNMSTTASSADCSCVTSSKRASSS